jgi:NADH-quinone oxidoreductase subunit N
MFDTASLLMTMPELILSAGGLVLLMIAAFAGDKATPAISWAAVGILLAAGLSLAGLPTHGGDGFEGLYRADA